MLGAGIVPPHVMIMGNLFKRQAQVEKINFLYLGTFVKLKKAGQRVPPL